MTGYNPVPITGAPVAGVGAVSVDSASGSNDFFITSVSTVSYSYLWNVMEAYYIDSKLDDGRPNSGKVRTTASYGRPSLHGSSAGCNGHPSTNDTGEYDLKGSWDTGGWEAVTDRPNVTRIECGLAFLNRF